MGVLRDIGRLRFIWEYWGTVVVRIHSGLYRDLSGESFFPMINEQS